MIVRHRIRVGGDRWTTAGRLVTGVLALGAAWYAGLLAALAFGADAGTVDALTGYRAALDWLQAPELPGRAVTGFVGLLVFALAGRMALAQVPRPRVPREALVLEQDPRGVVTVAPRAIERAVEAGVDALDGLGSARARWEPGCVTVAVSGTRAAPLAESLAAAPGAAREALRRHGLPDAEVQIVLQRFRSPSSTREVS
jgi:hypothetical protein